MLPVIKEYFFIRLNLTECIHSSNNGVRHWDCIPNSPVHLLRGSLSHKFESTLLVTTASHPDSTPGLWFCDVAIGVFFVYLVTPSKRYFQMPLVIQGLVSNDSSWADISEIPSVVGKYPSILTMFNTIFIVNIKGNLMKVRLCMVVLQPYFTTQIHYSILRELVNTH